MEFKTESQKACYEKVLPWLKEIFGEHFTRVREDAPVIGIVIGSALAQVAVYPWGDNDAIINTRAYVVSGAGDYIVYEHGIVGSRCDKEELKASVMAVALTADDYDDKIIARWGGQTALERMQG